MATTKLGLGEKFERYMRELANKVKNGGVLRVGFLEGSTYPDGTPVATIAAIQDFGAPGAGIPPRPFFRNVVQDGKTKWGEELTNLLKDNDYDAQKALSLMGEKIRGEIQQSITDGAFEPLKPATIARKGFDKPLIDTGHMLNSVDYEVTDHEIFV